MIKRINRSILVIFLSIVMVFSFLQVPVMAQTDSSSDYGLSNPRVARNMRKTIYFGNYWQDDTNGDGIADKKDAKTPIRWQILEKYDNGTALIMADKVLVRKQYYAGRDSDGDGEVDDYSCMWKTSSIREWLNSETVGGFLKEAFSDSEKKAIKTAVLTNEKTSLYSGESTGTSDKVFLLGDKWIKGSTGYDESRLAEYTAFANDGVIPNKGASTVWWVRIAAEKDNTSAGVIGYKGTLNTYNGSKVTNIAGVRPVLIINLSKNSEYSYGEDVVVEVVGSEWDTIKFGKNNEKDIVWRVLGVDGTDAFIMANEFVATRCFDSGSTSTVWNDSEIKEWLNNTFYDNSFSNQEKSAIKEIVLPEDIVNGGNETKNKIFLLSVEDIMNNSYGFSSKSEESYTRYVKPSNGVKRWWLRTTTKDDYNACEVGDYGNVEYIGDRISFDYGGVIPALHIDLSSNVWQKGAVVSVGDPSWQQPAEVLQPAVPTEDDESQIDPTIKPGDNYDIIGVKPTGTPLKEIIKKPAKTTLSKVSNKKGKKLTAKWKKVNGAEGYEIQYSLNKKFKKAKSKTSKKITFTINKLKSNKTYYVRVRAYKLKSSGEKVYGSWSKVKKIKIKK